MSWTVPSLVVSFTVAPVTTSVRAAASVKPSWWVTASLSTVTANELAAAAVPTETLTPAPPVTVPLRVCQVSGLARRAALLPRRAVSVFSARSADMIAVWSFCCDFSRFCEIASRDMSWSMIVAVSRPLTMPLMLPATRPS
jgi:hypothetical protein